MTPTKYASRMFTLVLPLYLFLSSPVATRSQTYTPQETSCYNMVQGRVAWDTAGHTNWNDVNLRNLCKGTTNASATVSCFREKIASGIVWSSATAACSPTALKAQPRKNNAA